METSSAHPAASVASNTACPPMTSCRCCRAPLCESMVAACAMHPSVLLAVLLLPAAAVGCVAVPGGGSGTAPSTPMLGCWRCLLHEVSSRGHGCL